ncbi:hypothetical protein DEI90_09765 [Curtobacterium sp. MCBD17_031]|nr:hypothetical protein DEI90_09765 [Curtobacterium sp. MCBD17_031]
MGGPFWEFKGNPDLLGVERVTADVRRQHISMTPFGDGRTLTFDAGTDVVTITDGDGSVVDRLEHPRRSMAGYAGETKWTAAQTGYFISYATWMYLLEPWLFTFPGVTTREIEPWSEDGETWRRLDVTFPDTIATHSSTQTYYIDASTGLQRRMNYDAEVNGWSEVAHYTSEYHDFGGLLVPTRRRVLQRNAENVGLHDFAGITLDVDDVELS